MAKIFIVIYSTYTHVYQLALELKKGIESASPSVQVELYQVPETLPQEILDKMHAPPKPDIPVITTAKLAEADGFLFGFPTRFGTMPAQFKSFLDSTGQLWFTNALNRKFAGLFFSTSTQHGGQETTAFTAVTYFAHHGIVYVPQPTGIPYYGKTDEIIGGGPWGSGTITGSDASRPISEKEKEAARTQGKDFAEVVSAYVNGKKAIRTEEKNEEIIEESSNPTTNQITTNQITTRSTEKKKKSKKNWLCCGNDDLLQD